MTGAALAPAGRRRRACPLLPAPPPTGTATLGSRRTCAQRRTRRANRCSSSAAGSLVRPVCTADGCTIVLDGAVSQWKRSDGSSAAIGPPVRRRRPPRARASRRCGAHLGRVAVRRQRRQRGLVELGARRRGTRAGGENSTTPAFRHSPRSTRGTTRTIAYWKSSRAGTLGLLHPFARRLEPALEMLGVRRAVGPLRRHERRRRGGLGQRRQPRVGLRDRARGAAAARARGSPGTAGRATASGSPAPWCTYSAAPWSISHRLPCQRSRFGLRGVRSTFSTSASSHTTAAASSGVGRLRRRVGQRARQEVHAEVQPALARIRSWISGSGSARASSASSSTSTSSGTGSPSRARQLAGHDLGRQRLRALARRRGT